MPRTRAPRPFLVSHGRPARTHVGLGARVALMSALAASLALPLAALPDDWPQYRGKGRDGRSDETGLLQGWPETGPKVLWRAPLGDGYSGIAVAGGRACTMFGDKDSELLACFDAATGKELWRLKTDGNRRDGMGSGPRGTPTVDGDAVFSLGASGQLVAADAKAGTLRWKHDLVAEYGAEIPQWGVSGSPLVEGNLLLLDVGGRGGHSLMAFDKKTGAVVWAAGNDGPGYSSPLAVTIDGLRQVLFFTGSALVSAVPESGKILWRVPWRTEYDVNAAMPVHLPPDKVFISSGYDTGATVVRVKKQGEGAATEEVWKSRVMKNHFNSSVLVYKYLYGFDDGTLKCIDAETGTEKWKQRGFGKGSLLYADGQLWVLSDQGTLALVEATPAEYKEKARFQLLNGKTWTMPTLAGGRLFVRSESELVALDAKR